MIFCCVIFKYTNQLFGLFPKFLLLYQVRNYGHRLHKSFVSSSYIFVIIDINFVDSLSSISLDPLYLCCVTKIHIRLKFVLCG